MIVKNNLSIHDFNSGFREKQSCESASQLVISTGKNTYRTFNLVNLQTVDNFFLKFDLEICNDLICASLEHSNQYQCAKFTNKIIRQTSNDNTDDSNTLSLSNLVVSVQLKPLNFCLWQKTQYEFHKRYSQLTSANMWKEVFRVIALNTITIVTNYE